MQPATSNPRALRIPPAARVAAFGLLAALVAIFVFKVALGTVLAYGLIGLMIFSHLFMHGSHGGHGSHAGHEQSNAPAASADGPAGVKQTGRDDPAGHSGCH